MKQYMCDRCGALVDDAFDLKFVKLGPSRAEVDEEHPFKPFWEGDLCKTCAWKLEVMKSRAVSNAEWRFSLNQDTIKEEYR